LLERVFGDGASGWSDGVMPPHTNARAAAFDTGREGRPELDLRARAGVHVTAARWLAVAAGAALVRAPCRTPQLGRRTEAALRPSRCCA